MKTDNELIAEFMGIHVANHGPVLYHSDEDGFIDFKVAAEPYWPDKCWNELMPVVEKIAEYRLAHPYETAKVCKLRVVVKKEALYSRVIEFIKWYNNEIH